MTNPECVEIIKSFIKEEAKEKEYISHSFFEEVKTKITNIRRVFPGLSVLDEPTFLHLYNVAVKEFQSLNPIEIDPSTSLTKKNFKTWLTEERKLNTPDDYINRYLTYLSKRGRSEKVVEEI